MSIDRRRDFRPGIAETDMRYQLKTNICKTEELPGGLFLRDRSEPEEMNDPVANVYPEKEKLITSAEITSAVGMDFFHLLNRYLAEALTADSVYVAEIPFKAEACLQTIAAYRDGQRIADYSFVAEGTPCHKALQEGVILCTGDLQEKFSGAAQLAPGIRSYLVMRLHGRNGQPIGVIALGWYAEAPDLDKARSVVDVIINRVSAELQRIRTAALLEEQLHFTQEILDAIPIPVFYKNSQLRYLGCNREYEKVIGLTKDELIGKKIEEVAPNDCFGQHEAVDHQVLESGQLKSYEGPFIYSNGDTRDVVFKKAAFSDFDNQRGGIVGTMFDITDLKRAEKAIYRLANYDPSTGLPNRQYFLSALEKSVSHACRTERKMAVLCLDLDHFKAIGNALGQDGCEQILRTYGDRITSQARGRDIYARIGTDRFAVILSSVVDEQAAELVARRILALLSESVTINEQEFHCTGSIGIAHIPADGINAANLLRNAENAMIRARKQGGNSYQHSSKEFNRAALERLAIEAGLRRSLADGGFELHYQPQVDLQSGDLLGAEALLRWSHPVLGPIPPGRFIPIAEESGLIGPIGDWVLKTACRQNAAWQAAGHPPIKVAVNLSGLQMRQGLADRVFAILTETGLDSEWLELELTETAMMENSEANIKVLHELKSLGINLSIDDFGTGYSSLSYLQQFPLDKLKIDRSFIRDLHKENSNAAITEAVIAITQRLNLKVLAEGIETTEQRDLLLASGCMDGQGHLYGHPVTAIEFGRHFQLTPCSNAG